ncbi:MAG: T9SS type A sorting domain-containing protein [Candidatus Delongbacteria bacterium]|nr:T9SS type A sorting domain-containing protein [Candidatus Delongbacteria bacterium]
MLDMIKRMIILSLVVAFCGLGHSVEIRAEKYVTIFYACWANECLNTTYGNDVYIMGETPYSPYPAWNWWGKPLYAARTGDGTIKNNYKLYFGSPDHPNRDLIDWHAQLLDSAGIDYITLDLTNGTQPNIVNGAKAICKRYQERINQGMPTPRIVFWVQDSLCLHTVESEIFNVYQGDVFFEYLGKKLVNVAGGNIDPAIPTQGIFSRYTCRRMWGLDNTGRYWQFKVNSATPPPPFYYNGEPEQMCVPVATQATYMTNDGTHPCTGAVGRRNGAYFITYMDAAIAADVKFVFIHSWNEWCAQNFGTPTKPVFTDLWKTEYSADIEPMEGGHGWYYFDLMCQKIAEFKNSSVGLDDRSHPPVSDDTILEQNYPNPFNTVTSINYSITNPEFISLKVFNISGQEVRSLVEEFQCPGHYSIDFYAGSLPSGLYFYTIQTETHLTQTKRMLYLK